MPIDTIKQEYITNLSIWEKARDVVEGGQEGVKYKREIYLPRLGGQTPDSYDAYLNRAQFINFTSRTITAGIGQIFRKDPVISNFDFDDIYDDIDLSGTPMSYFNRSIAEEIMKVNRVGVLVDYSEELRRPYLTMYKAESIINWRVERINGIEQPSMIVLYGIKIEPDPLDKFQDIEKAVYRELYLDESGIYNVRDWEKDEKDNLNIVNEYIPIANDMAFDYIPFYFVTSDGISPEIKRAPFLDLINLNLGHYKNSADYENMLHWTGARTVITKGWGDKGPFPIGGCADFPTDGGAEFLSAPSDSALLEEMRHKEEQMAVIGSAILSGKGRYVQSAETARITSSGEYATLADMSLALSRSMSVILSEVAYWMGQEQPVEIEFNTDFEIDKLDPQEVTAWMGLVQSGYMSETTFFYNMKSREMYPSGWTEEDEKQAIEEDSKKRIEQRENNVVNLYQNNQPENNDIQ